MNHHGFLMNKKKVSNNEQKQTKTDQNRPNWKNVKDFYKSTRTFISKSLTCLNMYQDDELINVALEEV